MFLKYIWKTETNVWKKDGKKSIVKPWEVFEIHDRVGKQYLNSYKHLYEETTEKPVAKKETKKPDSKKKEDKKEAKQDKDTKEKDKKED